MYRLIRLHFDKKPDFDVVGSQEVTVIIKDIYNNSTEIRSMLTVKEDTSSVFMV